VRPFGRTLPVPILIDGEIVAINQTGAPLAFQHLQPRLEVIRPTRYDLGQTRVALIAFNSL
jgi:ATP-dependent DNA ligase